MCRPLGIVKVEPSIISTWAQIPHPTMAGISFAVFATIVDNGIEDSMHSSDKIEGVASTLQSRGVYSNKASENTLRHKSSRAATVTKLNFICASVSCFGEI